MHYGLSAPEVRLGSFRTSTSGPQGLEARMLGAFLCRPWRPAPPIPE